jgi:hypothetical protein
MGIERSDRSGWKLTGEMRVRLTFWRRRLVVQVKVRNGFHTHLFKWRDATLADLQEVGSDEVVVRLSRALPVSN